LAAQAERDELPWWSTSRVIRKRTLNADLIVRAGLELIDRDGIEGLSMRRLGAHLGSGATSLYWHVPNKDALLDLIVDRLMEEANDSMRHEPGATWRIEVAVHAQALRSVLGRHGGAAGLLAARAPVGPQGLRFMEGLLGALSDAGFGGHQRALAYGALTSYTIGQAVLESRTTPTSPSGQPRADNQLAQLGGLLRGVPPDHYPGVFESAAALSELTDEQAFDYGLQRMLDGLEAAIRPVDPSVRL
jgi:AcrR family transcriptional regulator